jgi:hypothetical protein
MSPGLHQELKLEQRHQVLTTGNLRFSQSSPGEPIHKSLYLRNRSNGIVHSCDSLARLTRSVLRPALLPGIHYRNDPIAPQFEIAMVRALCSRIAEGDDRLCSICDQLGCGRPPDKVGVRCPTFCPTPLQPSLAALHFSTRLRLRHNPGLPTSIPH